MAKLPPDLLQRCRKVLSKSDIFDSNKEMRVLFTDARIEQWEKDLPEATTPAKRVNTTIKYLKNKFNKNKENGLVLFIEALSDDVPQDAYQQELVELANTLKPILQIKNTKSGGNMTTTVLKKPPPNWKFLFAGASIALLLTWIGQPLLNSFFNLNDAQITLLLGIAASIAACLAYFISEEKLYSFFLGFLIILLLIILTFILPKTFIFQVKIFDSSGQPAKNAEVTILLENNPIETSITDDYGISRFNISSKYRDKTGTLEVFINGISQKRTNITFDEELKQIKLP